MDFRLAEVWTVAGILLGFQATSFAQRIRYEQTLPAAGEPITRILVSDYLNLLSMAVLAVGAFALPTLGFLAPGQALHPLVIAVLLFVGHLFAMAGHYELYNASTKHDASTDCPLQERIAVGVVAGAVVAYCLLIVF